MSVVDKSVLYCSFLDLLATATAAAGPRCAQHKWGPTAIVFDNLRNWLCRGDATNRRAHEDGDLDAVIVLSDSTEGTEAGERRKSVGYCQCGGQQRRSRIVSEGTANRVQQVRAEVDVLLCGCTAKRLSLHETGSHVPGS